MFEGSGKNAVGVTEVAQELWSFVLEEGWSVPANAKGSVWVWNRGCCRLLC